MSEREEEEQGVVILLPRSEPKGRDVDFVCEKRRKVAILVQSAESNIRTRYVVVVMVEDKNDNSSLQYVAMLG